MADDPRAWFLPLHLAGSDLPSDAWKIVVDFREFFESFRLCPSCDEQAPPGRFTRCSCCAEFEHPRLRICVRCSSTHARCDACRLAACPAHQTRTCDVEGCVRFACSLCEPYAEDANCASCGLVVCSRHRDFDGKYDWSTPGRAEYVAARCIRCLAEDRADGVPDPDRPDMRWFVEDGDAVLKPAPRG